MVMKETPIFALFGPVKPLPCQSHVQVGTGTKASNIICIQTIIRPTVAVNMYLPRRQSTHRLIPNRIGLSPAPTLRAQDLFRFYKKE